MLSKIKFLLQDGSLKNRALRASALAVMTFGSSQVLRLASNLILTRILFPEAFGLMAIVYVFIVGFQMFTDIGLNVAIIQSKRGEDADFLNTGWTMQIMRGGLIALAALVLAAPIAQFYNQPMLEQMMPAVALNAIINGFLSTKMATANRKLLLARLTVIELGVQFFGAVVMIVLALLTGSVWSLMIGILCGSLLKVILSHFYMPGLPNRITIRRSALHELFHFGKYVFFSSIGGFMIQHGDRMVLGKFVPLEGLAVYNIAYFLGTVPLVLATQFVRKIMLPIYSARPTNGPQSNRDAIAKARYPMTACLIVLALFTSSIGAWLIELLYTPEYYLAGPILVVIPLAIVPGLIVASYPDVLMSHGDSRAFMIVLLLTAASQTVFLILGASNWGVLGAVGALALAHFVTYPVLALMLRKYDAWNPRHDLCFFVIACLIAALILWQKPEIWAQLAALIP